MSAGKIHHKVISHDLVLELAHLVLEIAHLWMPDARESYSINGVL